MTQQAPHEGMVRDESGGLVVWRWPEYVPPPKTPPEIAMDTIISLETEAHIASQRLYREAVIGMMEREAASIGMTPAQLAAKNKGYRELKAFDQQIASLRGQL